MKCKVWGQVPNDRPHISLTCRQTDRFDRPYRIQDLCWLVISYVVVVLSAVLTNLMFREIEKYKEPGLATKIVLTLGSRTFQSRLPKAQISGISAGAWNSVSTTKWHHWYQNRGSTWKPEWSDVSVQNKARSLLGCQARWTEFAGSFGLWLWAVRDRAEPDSESSTGTNRREVKHCWWNRSSSTWWNRGTFFNCRIRH